MRLMLVDSDDVQHGVDQRQVRECIREVAQVPPAVRIEVLGVQGLAYTNDARNNVFAWLRKGYDAHARCLVVVNFSPNVYHNYRVRVPFAGTWKEALNSDSAHYGGSNVGNVGEVRTLEGAIPELSLTLPPLAAIFLVPES